MKRRDYICMFDGAMDTEPCNKKDVECEDCSFGERDDKNAVSHPSHYNQHPTGVECEDVCEHFSWRVGAAIKYIWRHEHKHADGGIEDLQKAVNQLTKEIDRIQNGGQRYDRVTERIDT